ncbi:hypothetical protein NDU88_001676 [Pleurodeles waltl]|uniref:Uncharacterized protein n=1 Tax=Pleurodeles waltl TaxID=8319 RepID=A0AAV7KT97_PLEWA|nr:hypothetical protein NDU88_001676 [Pleurodeles waltl]
MGPPPRRSTPKLKATDMPPGRGAGPTPLTWSGPAQPGSPLASIPRGLCTAQRASGSSPGPRAASTPPQHSSRLLRLRWPSTRCGARGGGPSLQSPPPRLQHQPAPRGTATASSQRSLSQFRPHQLTPQPGIVGADLTPGWRGLLPADD